jgi:membrane fusion protein, multidrug efflux system
MKQGRVVGGIVLAVVIGIAAVGGVRYADKLRKENEAKPDVTLEFTPREVVRPLLTKMPLVISISGPLVAPQTAVVRAKASGTLLELKVAEGSRVRRGQLLGSLDLAELNSRVAERAAMLESARAQLVQAQHTHRSNEGLAAQKFISPVALETSRANLETARAQVGAAQAQLAAARVGTKEAVLLAPIDGVVAKRHALPGEKLSMEQQLLTLVDVKKLELAGSVGTHEVSLLAPGMALQVKVEGIEQAVPGVLSRIAPAAEAGSRSIAVTITVDNPNETFRAGQYALAQAVIDDPQPRLTVPSTAIGQTAGQDEVWVIDGGVLARRAVTTGRRDAGSGRVELLKGIDGQAQVLAARYDNLREGAKALVQPKAASANGAPLASGAAAQNMK